MTEASPRKLSCPRCGDRLVRVPSSPLLMCQACQYERTQRMVPKGWVSLRTISEQTGIPWETLRSRALRRDVPYRVARHLGVVPKEGVRTIVQFQRYPLPEGMLTTTEVAKMLGVTISTVTNRLKRLGVRRIWVKGARAVTQADVERIRGS